MATLCKLCDKKMGFFDGFHSPADVIICDKCYSLYEKVLDSVSDIETFKGNLAEFQSAFSEKEDIEKIVNHLNALHEVKLREIEENRIEEEIKNTETSEVIDYNVNSNIGPFENQDLVYKIDGVRGRHIDIYTDKVVITTKVTIGSLLTNNATDGEKTIYYSDCIGVQFKQSKFAIGYLQLETASSNGNNKHSNFFAENSFTFDTTVISNERMIEVADYVKSRVDAVKKGGTVPIPTNNNNVSVADELLKLKQLLDMGVLSQEEFDEQKNKLLNQ